MAKNKKNGDFDKIRKIIETKNSSVHFVGIGGVSMYSLARVSLLSSSRVSGSDREESHRTEVLRSLGVKVSIGHKSENITDQDIVVYTGAIAEDNAEILSAKKKNRFCNIYYENGEPKLAV